jgi:hypothetical protein
MRFTMATLAASRRDSLATADGCGARAWAGMPDNQATRGAMGIQFAVTVFDPAFRCDHGSTARNHCPNYVQRPSVSEDWPNEFH